MKRINLLLLSLLFTFYCFGQNPDFKITIDTINVNLKDIMKPGIRVSLTHAVKYHNKYYCFFNDQPLFAYNDTNRFFIFSDQGKFEREINIPYDFLIGFYQDLFIYNDRIILKNHYSEHKTYYLDTINFKWEEIEEVDDIIYEDKDYYVTFLDYGEWGYATWFKDKSTNKEYITSIYSPIINKINNDYYLTTGKSVYKINDFKRLPICEEKGYYLKEKIKKGETPPEYSSNEALDIIFKDTSDDEYSLVTKFNIATSFVNNNQLYHIYNDRGRYYIGYISDRKMIPIYSFDTNIHIFSRHNSYRCKIQKNKSQLLKFETNSENQYGFIEIMDNKINITYLNHNIDSIPFLGLNTFNMAFKSILNFYRVNNNITISQIDSVEKVFGATDIKYNPKGALHESYYPNKNKYSFEGAKTYVKVADNVISSTSKYYYTKNDSIVKTIFIQFKLTPNYKRTVSFAPFSNKPSHKNYFGDRFKKITDIITKQLGKPIINKEEIIWKTKNGLVIELDKRSRSEYRMVIYKD